VLFFVLILVLAALGALIAALVTTKSLFAWVSIGFSAAAALGLFVDWIKRRRAARRAGADGGDRPPAPEDESSTRSGEAGGDGGEVSATTDATDDAEEAAEKAGDTTGKPQAGSDTEAAAGPAAAGLPADLPGEEETDAADVLIVCELSDEVLVIDEQPRYHLAACGWLTGKETIPIAVSEARELGFTPCARCRPDATLAERARRKRVADTG